MDYILDAAQAKDIDRYTTDVFGMHSYVLMERAAYEAAACIRRLPKGKRRVFILAGCGNNGGDGLAIARILKEADYYPTLMIAGNTKRATKEWNYQFSMVEKLQIPYILYDDGRVSRRDEKGDLIEAGTEAEKEMFLLIPDADFYVDALFGIGISREITGIFRSLIEAFNQAASKRPDAKVIAVDIASGIDASTGKILGCCVRADITVTFSYAKLGHLFYPGAEYTGKLEIAQIGFSEAYFKEGIFAWHVTEASVREALPIRRADGNKGTFGKVLIAAGAEGMAGAACLAAEAAYRSGAGLVYVYTAAGNRQILQTKLPEAVFLTDEGDETFVLEKAVKMADAILTGPGLSCSDRAETIVSTICSCRGEKPLVLDADALNLIAQKRILPQGPGVIMTPHPGELSRLLSVSVGELREEGLMRASRLLADLYAVTAVCKDAVTVIREAEQTAICSNGCSGMATGGSGDTLAGLIAGLLAQGMKPFEAAFCGVWIHAAAGREAGKQLGMRGMLAGDLIKELPKVLRRFEDSSAASDRV